MRTQSRWLRVTVTLVALLAGTAAGVGCTAKSQENLVGTWRTQLTGYSTVAAGITQYDQTVTFTDAGSVTMDNT